MPLVGLVVDVVVVVDKQPVECGRWNLSGVETLYCSLDPLTAASEIDNLLAAQPVPIKRQRLTYPVGAQLSRVADNLAILVANLAAGDFYEPEDSYDYPPGPPSNVTYQPRAPVEPGAS